MTNEKRKKERVNKETNLLSVPSEGERRERKLNDEGHGWKIQE